jgi:hypothetical protein
MFRMCHTYLEESVPFNRLTYQLLVLAAQPCPNSFNQDMRGASLHSGPVNSPELPKDFCPNHQVSCLRGQLELGESARA